LTDSAITTVHIGECIYCRARPTTNDPLSDEHIFPFGLYGKRKLAKASCKKCRDITSAFEGKVQQDDMKHLRDVIGFPTRHGKRKLNSTLPHEFVTRNGAVKSVDLSLPDAPAIMILPVFKPPAYVSKQPYDEGIEMTGYFLNASVTHTGSIPKNGDIAEVAIYSLRWPEAWGRMFAKIAYAFAVAEYGLASFRPADVYVLNAILGKTNDVGNWVGCTDERVYGDEFNDQVAGAWIVDNNEVHVIVKLFAWLNSVPEYHVQGVEVGGFLQIQSTAQSTFNSLQMSLTKRLSKGFQFLASYAYGRSIDNASGGSDSTGEARDTINIAGNQLDNRANRGLSDFNRMHRFILSYLWNLQRPTFASHSNAGRLLLANWQIGGIVTAMSGLPIDIIDGGAGSLLG
jgi:hypothetical protein